MKKLAPHIPETTWIGLDTNHCKTLLLAILRRAILDMTLPCRFKGNQYHISETKFRVIYHFFRHPFDKKLRLFMPPESSHAWTWYFSDDSSYATSFNSICRYLEQEPDFVRSFKIALNMARYFHQTEKEEKDKPCPSIHLVTPLPNSSASLTSSLST